MDETSACYTEEFKKAFTKEQREELILSLVEYVDYKYLSFCADIHGLYNANSLRNGVKGYLKELMEREE